MTIAKQLKIKEFPFKIKDSKGNRIYWETSNGYWVKREYNSEGNLIYWETSNGYWVKHEYDSNGNDIYWEDSNGAIRDKRPKTDVQKAIELLTKEGLIVDGKILKN
jgi:broad specificity polyphosphatase/5'/3'-nucleotidase SurE